jgi:transposase
MSQYSEEFKASIIAKMLPPNNVSVPLLSQETGIPKDTLYTWRVKHRKANGQSGPQPLPSAGLSSEEKFAVVVETASLNEVELSEYCRRKGLYPAQISAWRNTCLQANASVSSKVERERLSQQANAIKQLEAELRRKEKALAEAAALWVLEKKFKRSGGRPRTKNRAAGAPRRDRSSQRGLCRWRPPRPRLSAARALAPDPATLARGGSGEGRWPPGGGAAA